jgi:hypothetical protein
MLGPDLTALSQCAIVLAALGYRDSGDGYEVELARGLSNQAALRRAPRSVGCDDLA